MEKQVHWRKFPENWDVGERAKQFRQTVWGGVAEMFPDIIWDRLQTVWTPKLVWEKNIQNLGFLLFPSYDLMSCEVFT